MPSEVSPARVYGALAVRRVCCRAGEQSAGADTWIKGMNGMSKCQGSDL